MSLFPHTTTTVKAEPPTMALARTGAALPAVGPVTLKERRELQACEERIARGLETFLEVGNALLEIQDKRLYRDEYGSFEEYCRERWQKSSRWARYHIDAAQVVNNLLGDSRDGDQAPGGAAIAAAPPVPKTESQARPLARLETKEQQRQAWDDAKADARSKGEEVTAKHVEAAVERVKPKAVRSAECGVRSADLPGMDFGVRATAECARPRAQQASILSQAGDIAQRMGALEQMLHDADDVTCLNLLRPAREKVDRIVACYVEERNGQTERPLKETKKAKVRAKLQEIAKARWKKVQAKQTAAARRLERKVVKANAHGVYPDELAEKLTFRHGKLTATVRLLELSGGEWISTATYDYAGSGDDAGGTSSPLTADTTYGAREDALLAALGTLSEVADIKKGRGNLGWRTAEGRKAAGALAVWGHDQAKKARKVAYSL